jgi:hypothetical protein
MKNLFGRRVVVNKGSRTAPMLPGKRAMRKLTGGDPDQMALGNYAKMTPSGAGGFGQPNILGAGVQPAVISALDQDTDES